MLTSPVSTTPHHWCAALLLGLAVSGSALAQTTPTPPAPAATSAAPVTPPAPPPPNPAAEKALHQHFVALYNAIEGKADVPDSKNFSEAFNQQVQPGQLKQVFEQVHKTVGSCRIAGQLRTNLSFISSYLLQCDKGFVPIDIAVEEKAPYRVHSFLLRPGYSKL